MASPVGIGDKSVETNVAIWFLVSGSAIFLTLRLVLRHRSAKLWWDDLLLTVSWVCPVQVRSSDILLTCLFAVDIIHRRRSHKSHHHRRIQDGRRQTSLLLSPKHRGDLDDNSNKLDKGRLRCHVNTHCSTQIPALLPLVYHRHSKHRSHPGHHLDMGPGLRRPEGQVPTCQLQVLQPQCPPVPGRCNNGCVSLPFTAPLQSKDVTANRPQCTAASSTCC